MTEINRLCFLERMCVGGMVSISLLDFSRNEKSLFVLNCAFHLKCSKFVFNSTWILLRLRHFHIFIFTFMFCSLLIFVLLVAIFSALVFLAGKHLSLSVPCLRVRISFLHCFFLLALCRRLRAFASSKCRQHTFFSSRSLYNLFFLGRFFFDDVKLSFRWRMK